MLAGVFRVRVGVAVVCGLVARGAAAQGAAPAEDDVGPVPAAAVESAAEGPAAAPAAAVSPVNGATTLPGVEVSTAKRVRHDWYVGFGFGLGGGNLRPAGVGTGGAGSAAIMALVRGGGRITDRVAIGGLAVTALGGGNGAARGFSNLMAEGLFFPVKDRGLALGVGLGLSSTYGGRNKMDGSPAEVEALRTGVGFGLGIGYEFWLARRFNLGIWLRGDGSAGPKYGLRAGGTLGLAFAWY
jgi:hypothetical protein